MTHVFMAFYEDGKLVLAKPVICKDEEELNQKFDQFVKSSIDEGIGDFASYITEEESTVIDNLNVDELFDVGI